jgi:preprotein translocase subunit SecD
MRRSLLGWWLLAGVAALGICWYLFVLAPRRDSSNGDENTHRRRPPWLDINKVGGTILVYEVDQAEPLTADRSHALPQAIENRVDPDGDLSVTVRLLGKRRVEIVVPRQGNRHGEDVERIKDLIGRVGSLEFRILANRHDDEDAIQIAKKYFREAADSWKEFVKRVKADFDKSPDSDDKRTFDEIAVGDLAELKDLMVKRAKKNLAEVNQYVRTNFKPNQQLTDLMDRAASGLPPPPPVGPDGTTFKIRLEVGDHRVSYSWVELSKSELHALRLINDPRDEETRTIWLAAEKARNEGLAVDSDDIMNIRLGKGTWTTLFYSRSIPNPKVRLAPRDRDKKHEYFVLSRNPEPGKAVTGQYLSRVRENVNERGNLGIGFQLNEKGAKLFYELTNANRPPSEEGDSPERRRFLAIVLDGLVMSAPRLNAAIRDAGIIEGKFTKAEIDALINILRSGALPATLKPQPVSETSVGPADKP